MKINLIIPIALIFLVGSTCALPMNISGNYISKHDNITIEERPPGKAALLYGDVEQVSSSCADDRHPICFMFDNIDILIPKTIAVGEKSTHKNRGLSVAVVEKISNFETDGLVLCDTYRLLIKRKSEVNIDGRTFNRGPEKLFEIYYSVSKGLVGFDLNTGGGVRFIVERKTVEVR